TPGAKFFHWERRGVPVLFELGPRDVASGNIVMKRRDAETKRTISQTQVVTKFATALEVMQKDLYRKAKDRLKENTVLADSIEEVEAILKDATAEKGGGKFVMGNLNEDPRNALGSKE